MKHKIMLAVMLACVVISGGIVIAATAGAAYAKPDLVEISRIKLNAEQATEFLDFQFSSTYDFAIVALDGSLIFSTVEIENMPLDERTEKAVGNFDVVIDYEQNGAMAGKIFIYTGKTLSGNKALRITAVVIPFVILSVVTILYYLYMRFYLYKPFKRLKAFASDIATGNLDLPLPMDKDNLFGEFTESFDLMREELKFARKKAIEEERSKKELIATLTHDIKTPVSIIRVASQLLESGETDAERLENIDAIKAKTSEIDTLISDLFSFTLEELSELKVEIKEIEAGQIEKLIKNADQSSKVRLLNSAPECLIKADSLRLNQVIGNIISNAYKYAGTDIEVGFALDGKKLKISFKDFGSTLQREDLFLIKNKFFRGKNASGKDGAGLGLYICQKLLDGMGGGLDFNLDSNGFTVIVSVALS